MSSNLLLMVGLAVASLGLFAFLYGLDRARKNQDVTIVTEPVQTKTTIKLAAPRGPREMLSRILQPLGERMYDREPRAGKKAGKKVGLQQKLLRAGLHLRSGEFLAIQIGCVSAAIAVALFRFGIGWQAMAMATLAYFVPSIYVGQRMGHRQAQFSTQLPEVLMQLSNGLRAGVSLGSAMQQVADSGRKPISDEFAKVTKEIALGGAVEEVLQKMVRRAGNADLELMVIAIGIHRRVGGNLAEVLESIAETIRERVKIKGDIKTLTTQARTSGYIITGLPVLLATFLYFIMPAYFLPMTQSFFGWALLGFGVVLLFVGNAIMGKIVKIEV
jgi:tight adherence protein B